MTAFQVLKRAIVDVVKSTPVNRDEAYVDRIKREFKLREYHQARELYEENPSYWERLYGSDPLTSQNRPASLPSSLVPRPPPAPEPSYGLFDPTPMAGNSSGPFGSGGRFVPGAPASLRPRDGLLSPELDNSKPPRRLVRVENTSGTSVFDSGAPAVPLFAPSPVPPSGRPASFSERFSASTPAASASPAATPADDLEAFRRHWIKAFLEP